MAASQGIDALADGKFCMEGWIKLDAAVTASNIAFGDHQRGYVIVPASGATPAQTIALAFINASGGTNNIAALAPLELGRWYHVAVQWDGPSIKMYIDGNLAAQNDPTTQPARQAPTLGGFGIGTWGSSAQFYWNGSIDEVAVFRGVRYPGNFTPPTAPYVGNENGLSALYHLDGNANPAPVP